MTRLRNFLNLEPGEGFPAFLLFAYMTLVLSAYIIQKSVRDALFLHDYGAMGLPYLYISVAVVIAGVVAIYVRMSRLTGQITLISGTLLLFMLNGLVLWWTAGLHWRGLSIIYYLWANTSGLILTAQMWTLAATIFTPSQSRRLFPLICSGGILGSTLGGVIAAAAARRIGTDNLILVPVFLLAGSLVIVQITGYLLRHAKRDPTAESEPAEATSSVREVLKVTIRTRYLRLIASLLSLSAIVALTVDFQFKTVIQKAFQDRDAMAAFFGSFYAYVGLFAFVFQLCAGSRLSEKYGIRMALLFLPLALLGGTAALLVYPGMMWTGLFLKGSDGILRGSIDKSTVEMLYVPVPDSLKVQVKAVIDVLIQRFSDGVGGILLLVMTHALGLQLYGIGVFNIVLLALWIWIARKTRKEYQVALRQAPVEEPLTAVIPSKAA